MIDDNGIYGEINTSSIKIIHQRIKDNAKNLVDLIKGHKNKSRFNEDETLQIQKIAESFININPQNLAVKKDEISGQISDKDVGVGLTGARSKHRSRRSAVTAIFSDLVYLDGDEVSGLTDISEGKKSAAQKIVEIARSHINEQTAIYEVPIGGPGVEPRAAWSEPTYMEPILLADQGGTMPEYFCSV